MSSQQFSIDNEDDESSGGLINNDNNTEEVNMEEHSDTAHLLPSPITGSVPDDDEDDEEEETLEDYAGVVVTILQPVAITMLLVVWIVRTINLPIRGTISASMVYEEQPDDSTGTKFLGSIANALIFLAIIIATTVLFVILYKYRCLKVIYGWLMMSTCMLLGMFGGYMFYLFLYSTNMPLDIISFSFLLWNFSIVGIMAIFWHAPTKINQAYLVIISALLAIYFTRLPEWTTWAILAIVAIYDLFAVLCPRGPLKVLVETAQERKEPIPALLYNASVFIMGVSPDVAGGVPMSRKQEKNYYNPDQEDNGGDDDRVGSGLRDNGEGERSNRGRIAEEGDGRVASNNNNNNAPQPQQEEKRGVKLGLGDFVFYSVLMGRAALLDMVTVFTCFTGIITGLFLTLLLLAVFRKALPALPISIALGIFFFILTKILLMPYVYVVGSSGVFV